MRPKLLERRTRLEALKGAAARAYVAELLEEVDQALARIEDGSYGYCETCHDPIEPDRLERDPMLRFCLDHLSAEQRKAHQQDLDLAAEIQMKLLPSPDMTLEGWETHYRYEPVGAVGGDYCELLAPGGGKSLFFAVGDVAGKGVAASLLMTHLSAIFRSLLTLNLPLEEVMGRANRLFCESTATGHYATLVCGRASGEGIEFCDAGHCTPLLLRKGGTVRFESTGLPLGLFCEVPYMARRVRMESGDSLVLYTDGITEALDEDGNDYGEERLVRAAREAFAGGAQSIGDGIIKDVARFRMRRPAVDDVTVLVIRRR